jgi:hypothetical protein
MQKLLGKKWNPVDPVRSFYPLGETIKKSSCQENSDGFFRILLALFIL